MAKLEKVFEVAHSSSIDLMHRVAEFLGDAKKAIGLALFSIATYTAVLIYRSPSIGKQTSQGEEQMRKLKKVMQTVSSHEFAVEAELAVACPLSAEMRAAVRCPVPELPRMPSGLVVSKPKLLEPGSSQPASTVEIQPTSAAQQQPTNLPPSVTQHEPTSVAQQDPTSVAQQEPSVDP